MSGMYKIETYMEPNADLKIVPIDNIFYKYKNSC